MMHSGGRLVVAILATTAFSGAVVANTAEVNRSAEAGAAPSAVAVGVERAALAADLAAYGRDTGSAVALLLAGQITSEVGATKQAREKSSEADEGAAASSDNADAKTDRVRPTAETLFAEARTLAGADRELVSRIERAAGRQTKGRVGGPTTHWDAVNARTNDWYDIPFRGGEPARISVVGDGDTDLDLFIYDQNGNLVCSDTDYTDRTYCAQTPAWTGNFRVRIRNLGRVYNNYVLRTN